MSDPDFDIKLKHKSENYILGIVFIIFVQTERFEWTKRTKYGKLLDEN